MKTAQVKLGGQLVTLTHGIDELLALSALTGADLLKGKHWVQSLTSENFLDALAILARRAHPALTVDGLRASLPAEAMQIVIEAIPALVGEPDPLPPSASDGAHSVASISG